MWLDQLTSSPNSAFIQIEWRIQGEWQKNNGTATSNVIQSSSGSSAKQNPAWKAADGVLTFEEFKEGWDCLTALMPHPAPGQGNDFVSWAWDGINGNNGLWFGSLSSGLRTFLKGLSRDL